MKYLENYDIYKQTLIEGLGRSKSHFLDLFATWNHEVFPRSLPVDQVSDVIPDSQPASCSGRNMGGKQGVDMNNVANILRQLSFEENEKEDEDPEEDYHDSSESNHDGNSGYYHDGFEHNNFDSDHSNCNDNDNFHHDAPASESEPPQAYAQSLRVIPITVDSVPSSSFITDSEPTAMAISSPTPETQLTAEVVQCDQSSKAPPTGKKPSRRAPVQTQKGQSRSSSRLTKALQVADPLSLPSPIQQPIIDTTDDVPPPKPKRATCGRAATKGKMCASWNSLIRSVNVVALLELATLIAA